MQVIRKYGTATNSPRTTGPSPIVWNKIPRAEIAFNPGKGFGFFSDFLAVGTANAGGTTLIDESGPWIAAQLPRQVHHGKENVAQLFFDSIWVSAFIELNIEFVEFFLDLLAGTVGIGPIEADAGGPLLQPHG